MTTPEVCPIIIGSESIGILVTGIEEPAYSINVIDDNFCNPSTITALLFDGTAIFDGTFVFK